MKLLLVVKSKKMENLGVMYLAAVIKAAGHEAKIVDIENALTSVKSWRPDTIGYSIMTGDQQKFRWLNENIKCSSAYNPTTIAGGPHATFFPDDFKNDPFMDIVWQGEGENFIAETVSAIPNYAEINSIPWPDRVDFPDMKIRDFITTRGCPGECSYCYNDRWAKMFPEIPKIRTRSVVDVVKEIDAVSPDFVYFQDSCFALSLEWLRKFSNLYKHKIGIPFHCHLRPSQVDEERILLLGDAGCFSMRIALESASLRLRTLLKRRKLNLKDMENSVRLMKKWNIKLMIQNIIGLPTGSIDDDLETLEFNVKCKPTYGWVSIFTPYPGTDLGDLCVREGWYKGDYSDIGDNFFDKSVLEFDEVYKEQLECLQKVFALCVETGCMVKAEELTYANFPALVHGLMRKLGDRRMYGGVI